MTYEFLTWYKYAFILYIMQAFGFFITHVVSVAFGGVAGTDDSKCKRQTLTVM